MAQQLYDVVIIVSKTATDDEDKPHAVTEVYRYDFPEWTWNTVLEHIEGAAADGGRMVND